MRRLKCSHLVIRYEGMFQSTSQWVVQMMKLFPAFLPMKECESGPADHVGFQGYGAARRTKRIRLERLLGANLREMGLPCRILQCSATVSNLVGV